MPRSGDCSNVKQLPVEILHTRQHYERNCFALKQTLNISAPKRARYSKAYCQMLASMWRTHVLFDDLYNVLGTPLFFATPPVNVEYRLFRIKPVLLYNRLHSVLIRWKAASLDHNLVALAWWAKQPPQYPRMKQSYCVRLQKVSK